MTIVCAYVFMCRDSKYHAPEAASKYGARVIEWWHSAAILADLDREERERERERETERERERERERARASERASEREREIIVSQL